MESQYDITKSILKRFLANWSASTSAPKKTSGGYVYLVKSTGQVWVAESKDFKNLVGRFNAKKRNPQLYPKAVVPHLNDLELWLHLRPELCSWDDLTAELEELGVMMEVAPRTRDRPGRLFCIRHRISNSYFLSRSSTPYLTEFDVLKRFLMLLRNYRVAHGSRANKMLQQFINDYPQDILTDQNFAVGLFSSYQNLEEAREQAMQFQLDNVIGVCMNDREFY